MLQLSKASNLKWALILVFAVLLVPATHADTVYTLNLSDCSSCGTGPYGSIDLAQDGNSVFVTVTLSPGYEFAKTGTGYALEFNVSGNATITDTDLTTGFLQEGSTSTDTFGSFDDTVWCNAACPLSQSHLNPGPLSFVVSMADGSAMTVDDFVDNSDGNFFASNILGPDGIVAGVVASNNGTQTDSTDSTDLVTTPEPGVMLMLGAGLMSLLGIRRKRLTA